jgi:hypothetical protein
MRITKQRTLEIIAELKAEIKGLKIQYTRTKNQHDKEYIENQINVLIRQLSREENTIEIMGMKNVNELSFFC